MKFIVLSIAMLFFCAAGFAQQKVSGKAIIKTPTIPAEKCKEWIEFKVAREYGVTSVKVNLKQKTTTVTWLTDRTNIENIKVAIANLGYDADDIEAEEYAYSRLSKECKVPKAVTTAPVTKE